MNKLSVAIITKNEEKNIGRCLESVKWADEIVVVDSGSTDSTMEICKKYHCKIFQSPWLGFSRTKQIAVDYCTNEWVLVIDADEEITPNLKVKILDTIKSPGFSGYRIKRRSFYLGQLIQHCGWNKDYPLRLFEKAKGKFDNKIVHESIEMSYGKTGTIEEVMLHYTYPDLHSHLSKIDAYTSLGAAELFEQGESSSISKAVMRGIFKFIKMYFLQLGLFDGKTGFVLCINSAYGVCLKYLKLWEMRQSNKQ
jgi:glycosyltransferase involved in cell wall biosynthesis